MLGLLLDLDDTLLDDRAAVSTALSALLTAHRDAWRRESEQDALQRWQSVSAKIWRQYERGELSFQEQRRARVRSFLQKELSDSEADIAFQPYQRTYEAAWRQMPGCGEFLKRTTHIPKVIITDGDREQQMRKVAVTGLGKHVQGIITPEDCGYRKPQPEIFIAASNLLAIEPAACFMVGDDQDKDIAPARALGMLCYQIVPGNQDSNLADAAAFVTAAALLRIAFGIDKAIS